MPSLWPRSPSLAFRGRRRRLPSLRTLTMEGLFTRVIAAVNARGMCAAEVARIAELPTSEVAAMANRCGCASCFIQRAN